MKETKIELDCWCPSIYLTTCIKRALPDALRFLIPDKFWPHCSLPESFWICLSFHNSSLFLIPHIQLFRKSCNLVLRTHPKTDSFLLSLLWPPPPVTWVTALAFSLGSLHTAQQPRESWTLLWRLKDNNTIPPTFNIFFDRANHQTETDEQKKIKFVTFEHRESTKAWKF